VQVKEKLLLLQIAQSEMILPVVCFCRGEITDTAELLDDDRGDGNND
jgi:hypothetical protein